MRSRLNLPQDAKPWETTVAETNKPFAASLKLFAR
jgi:hypothetical protein